MRVERTPRHPFLYFSATDIPRLRERAGGTHKQYFEDLKAWAADFAEFDPIGADSLPDNRDTLQVYYENGAPYIINMSLLYHLTGDEAYAEAAEKWLLTFCTYPTETRGGYFIGAYAVAVASGYDMLYDYLSEEQRTTVREHLTALVERGFRGVLGDWWAGISLHHDHWLPITGLGVGAIAIYGEVPESAAWLARFVDTLRRGIDVIGGDGAWTEGTAEGVYAMGLTYVFCEAFRNLTGENLFDLPFIKNASLYRLYNWLPNDTYIYHHDSHASGRYNVMGSASCHLLRKLAAEHRDGYAQWLADREEPRDVNYRRETEPHKDWMVSKAHMVPKIQCVAWNFLWYDPTVKPQPPADLPLYRYFPNQGLIILRSGWTAGDLVFSFTCAPAGGHKGRAAVVEGDERLGRGITHIHALANSFDLFVNGNYLAIPPGYGERGSECHNTLTIEGAAQRLNPRYLARIRRHDFQEEYSYFLGDATECYPEETRLKRWYRHVAYLPPNTFVMCDELAASEPFTSGRPSKWHLNFNPLVNEVSIDGGAQTITISSRSQETDTGAMTVVFLEPRDLEFEKTVLRHPTRRYVRFGQVSVGTKDIFRSESRVQILAVITALENATSSPPDVRLVKGDGFVGAVLDEQERSRCVLLFLGDAGARDDLELDLTLRAKPKLACYLFSLLPDAGYDVAASSRIDSDGSALHKISIRRGTEIKTSAAGSLIIRAEAK